MVDEIIGKGVVEWRERRAWAAAAGGASFAVRRKKRLKALAMMPAAHELQEAPPAAA